MGGLFSYPFVIIVVTFILAFLKLGLFLLRQRLRQDKLGSFLLRQRLRQDKLGSFWVRFSHPTKCPFFHKPLLIPYLRSFDFF